MQFASLMVYVQDMPRSVAFYRDVLGLPLEMQSPGWSQFSLGNGLILGLHAARDQRQPAPGWVPGFGVDDIQGTKARLQEAGAAITSDYHDIPGGVTLGFSDPDGNTIDVAQMAISCGDLGVASR